ncbi:MAG: hypothetical protein JWN24_1178 [Phycisphaerales bacterium]|nr:hypothetical protein [Phycisphaerales bacterium]
MSYGELIRLYFERSIALQWYWTIYVVVVGGLLAFSSLRQRSDLLTAGLVTVLFCFFAYKNLGAIGDVTIQRNAVVKLIKEYGQSPADSPELKQQRAALEPTLVAQPYEGIRNFHLASDALTVAALWAMEWRRWKHRNKPAA